MNSRGIPFTDDYDACSQIALESMNRFRWSPPDNACTSGATSSIRAADATALLPHTASDPGAQPDVDRLCRTREASVRTTGKTGSESFRRPNESGSLLEPSGEDPRTAPGPNRALLGGDGEAQRGAGRSASHGHRCPTPAGRSYGQGRGGTSVAAFRPPAGRSRWARLKGTDPAESDGARYPAPSRTDHAAGRLRLSAYPNRPFALSLSKGFLSLLG